MFKNKKVLISMATLAAVTVLATGTFAWTQYAHKVNEFFGDDGEIIVIHDDFDVNTGSKEIYVENNSTNNVYVRARLDEFMDLTSSLPPTNAQNPDGTLGSFNWLDYTTYTYTPSTEEYNIPAWFPEYNGFRVVDVTTGQGTTSVLDNPAPNFRDYFHWILGGQKYYMPAGANSGRVVTDRNVYDGSEPGVAQTPLSAFTSVTAFNALEPGAKTAFVGWLYDVADGYFYWSKGLATDEVTGLLLHKVYTDKEIRDDNGPLQPYYYAIDIKVEAVDIDDIPMWTTGAPSVDDEMKIYVPASAEAITAIEFITQ